MAHVKIRLVCMSCDWWCVTILGDNYNKYYCHRISILQLDNGLMLRSLFSPFRLAAVTRLLNCQFGSFAVKVISLCFLVQMNTGMLRYQICCFSYNRLYLHWLNLAYLGHLQ